MKTLGWVNDDCWTVTLTFASSPHLLSFVHFRKSLHNANLDICQCVWTLTLWLHLISKLWMFSRLNTMWHSLARLMLTKCSIRFSASYQRRMWTSFRKGKLNSYLNCWLKWQFKFIFPLNQCFSSRGLGLTRGPQQTSAG